MSEPSFPISHERIQIASGRSHPELAEQISQLTGIKMADMALKTFANSEIHVRYAETVRKDDLYIVQSFAATDETNVNDQLIETFQMIDAARRASASWVTLIAPNMAYARQDRQADGRESPFAATALKLLGSVGLRRLITVDPHSQQTQSALESPTENLSARPIITNHFAEKIDGANGDYVVVAPDTGGAKSSEAYATALGTDFKVLIKKRDPRTGAIELIDRIDGVGGKHCLVIDDMIDTAGTIQLAAETLDSSGAKSVSVATTHGLFNGPALERLRNAPINHLVTTDTVPQHRTINALGDRVEVLPIAPTIAEAIARIAVGESVSDLYGGRTVAR